LTIITKRPFSHEEIAAAVNDNPRSMVKVAKALTAMGRGDIRPQQVRLWLTQMDTEDFSDGLDRAKEVVRSRNATVENNKLRADVRALVEQVGTKQGYLDGVEQICHNLNERPPVDFKGFIGGQSGTPMTVELLLSDLQIGKLSPGYNTLVARKRLFEFGRAALFQIEQKCSVGYRIERIVLALLGDIIESDKKHKNSARATDTGTAEQIADAMEGLFEFVIEPLARLGIPMEIVGITGNHDWDDHGLNMFQPGKQQLSWPLYRGLEMITRRAGYSHVAWAIPEGSYAIVDFYGQYTLYEHGVGVSVSEAAMKAHKVKRAEQEKKHLTYFRMGDKHTVTMFNSGQMVVNGAFFGAAAGGTEYSGIAGYSSVPAQWMGFHVARSDNRLSLYDNFVIQLDHVSE
jgi:hypothetical protein